VDWSRQFILFHAQQRKEGEILSDNFLDEDSTRRIALGAALPSRALVFND